AGEGRDGGTPATQNSNSPETIAADAHDSHGLAYLQDTARRRGNVFEALMEAVKTHSLRQISHALYAVGGEDRRNMGCGVVPGGIRMTGSSMAGRSEDGLQGASAEDADTTG